MRYKPVKIQELPAILALMQRSKAHFHENQQTYVDDFVKTWGPNAYYIDDHILLKAFNETQLIGFIGMRGPSANRIFPELDMLFIDSQHIGKGYGRMLWEKVLAVSEEQRWPSFRFISDNIPQIIGFYEHMGALTVDRLKLESGTFPIMEYRF